MKYELSAERQLKKKLDSLFDDWKKTLIKNGASKEEAGSFVTDGFYPFYTAQKFKVLFVGRESVGLSYCDYIEVLCDAIKNKSVNGQSLNQRKVESLCLYIAYGLNNNVAEYQKLPWATDIADSFAAAGGISYAFMNLSKISNEKDNGHEKADWDAINRFVELSKSNTNFFQKEIELLNPDAIISMNIDSYLPLFGKITDISEDENVRCKKIIVNGRNIPLIDTTSHFSYPYKSPETGYYAPILDVLL